MNTENKLPEDFKQKWVAALRSGEYKQGKEELHNSSTDCYCCLGVAGKIIGLAQRTLDMEGHLPVVENVPLVIQGYSDVACTLVSMNDSGEKSFSQIADWIEQNL